VLADHGFAGAAIDAGVETLSVADVNDPALIVAKAQGRTDVVVVMDDNVAPGDYWPCFQAAAARVRAVPGARGARPDPTRGAARMVRWGVSPAGGSPVESRHLE
jgi:hypothetical protein